MLMMRKKQIIIVALSLMIVIAAYLNWNYSDNSNLEIASIETAGKRLGEAEFVSNNDVEVQETNTTDDTYFKDARLNREKSRSDKQDMLNQIVSNEDSSKEAVKQAEESLVNMAGYVEKESNIENQLKAKGFGENMVFITEDSVTITVKTQGLQPADTAKITDIVLNETKLPADKIKIVEVK